MSVAPPRSRTVTLLVVLAAAVPFGFLIAHYHWLCDDAFISFRYAKNLADGHGLRFNVADPPIEGYSNFLWVLALAGARKVGLAIPDAALGLSIASAALLYLAVARHLARRLAGPSWTLALPLAVFATLPPLGAWATSGLATMPAALALFVLWERLFGADGPRPVGAALAAAAAILLRADGFLFVALLCAAALVVHGLHGLARGSKRDAGAPDRARLRARRVLVPCVVAALAFGGLTAFRWAYFGDWLPNTARVKAPANAINLERGLAYDVNYLLTFLAVPGLALLAAVGSWREPRRLTAWALVLATFGYAAWVGGDFMAMGRLVLVALPFLVVLAADALHRLAACCRAGTVAAGALALALVGLSVATTLERYPVPKATLERWPFRWSARAFYTEVEQWGMMKMQGLRWSVLGRALRRRTQPGESVVCGTIGALGYYSDLHVYDTFGLTNQHWKDHPPKPGKRSSPGHERHIPLQVFLDRNPTYANVGLVQSQNPYEGLPGVLKPLEDRLDMQWIPLPQVPGAQLRLVRWLPEGGDE